MLNRKFFVMLTVAVLGLSLSQEAPAPIGGTGSWKAITLDQDLLCTSAPELLSRPTVPDDPPRGPLTNPLAPFFTLDTENPAFDLAPTRGDELWCWEVDHGTDTPIRNDDGELVEGLVKVEQSDNPPLSPTSNSNNDPAFSYDGLSATWVCDPEGSNQNPATCNRLWTIVFAVKNGAPKETALWEFIPINETTRAPDPNSPLCTNAAGGGGISDSCLVNVGLPGSKFGVEGQTNESDWPARDVDGEIGDDLEQGQVFTYTVLQPAGADANTGTGVRLTFGPCTSGTFNGNEPVNDGCVADRNQGTGKPDLVRTDKAVFGAPDVTVAIDILPGDDSNEFDRNTDDVVSVCIGGRSLVDGSPLDLSKIDTGTVQLAGVPALGGPPPHCRKPEETPCFDGGNLENDLTCDFDRKALILARPELSTNPPEEVDDNALELTAEWAQEVKGKRKVVNISGTDPDGEPDVKPKVKVVVDFKQGACPAQINPNNQGTEPFVILGGNAAGQVDYVLPETSVDFTDVTQINPGTVQIGKVNEVTGQFVGVAAVPVGTGSFNVPVEVNPNDNFTAWKPSCPAVDDGIADDLKFSVGTQALMQILCEDPLCPADTEFTVTVRGNFDNGLDEMPGTPFTGTDSVTINQDYMP